MSSELTSDLPWHRNPIGVWDYCNCFRLGWFNQQIFNSVICVYWTDFRLESLIYTQRLQATICAEHTSICLPASLVSRCPRKCVRTVKVHAVYHTPKQRGERTKQGGLGGVFWRLFLNTQKNHSFISPTGISLSPRNPWKRGQKERERERGGVSGERHVSPIDISVKSWDCS